MYYRGLRPPITDVGTVYICLPDAFMGLLSCIVQAEMLKYAKVPFVGSSTMAQYKQQTPGRDTPEFMTTRWTLVLAAADMQAGTSARRALEELAQTYWFPLYAYARQLGKSAVESEDLTQAFFARMIEKNTLSTADRTKGKFRSFLLASFRNFIINEYEKESTLKRGYSITIHFDVTDAENQYNQSPTDALSPERVFEQRWAWTVLDQVLVRLREHYVSSGQVSLFDALKGSLAASPEEVSSAQIAKQLGITENAVDVATHRLRKRYREMVRAEIAQTVADPSLVDEEIQYLLSCL